MKRLFLPLLLAVSCVPGYAANSAVSIPAGADVSLGSATDAAAAGNGSLIAVVKQLRALLGLTAALGDATANPTVLSFGGYNFGFNGTTWDRLQVDGSKNLKVTLPTRTETTIATRNSAGNVVALATALALNTAASVVVVDLTGHLGGVLQFTQVFPNAAPTATTGLVVQIGYNVSGSNTSDTQYFTTWTLASVQNATQTGSIRLDGGYKYAVLVKNSDTTSAITYGITLDTNDRVTN